MQTESPRFSILHLWIGDDSICSLFHLGDDRCCWSTRSICSVEPGRKYDRNVLILVARWSDQNYHIGWIGRWRMSTGHWGFYFRKIMKTDARLSNLVLQNHLCNFFSGSHCLLLYLKKVYLYWIFQNSFACELWSLCEHRIIFHDLTVLICNWTLY